MNNKTKKGFTLIELLIVIGILAVLAGAVILVINPAEMLAQARDTKRISDLNTINSALSLYVSQVSPIVLTATNAAGNCSGTGVGTAISAGAGGPFVGICVTNALLNVTGTGWVDVNLSAITGGSPVTVLPNDPTNSTSKFYAYKGTNSTTYTYKLATALESTKYSPMMTTDGGATSSYYELGTNVAL